MEITVVVVDADENQCHELCSVLKEGNYPTTSLHSLLDLQAYIRKESRAVIIMDIDTIHIDNRTIKEIVLKNPGTYFLCLSRDRFHPHLKDAICYHIYACINKPVDFEELFYWLKSIYEHES
jgi:DNA-binding NtrC family response regulator